MGKIRFDGNWTAEKEEKHQKIKVMLECMRDPEISALPKAERKRIMRLRLENRKLDGKMATYCRTFWRWAQQHAAPADLEKIEWALRGFVEDVVVGAKRRGVEAYIFGKVEDSDAN